MEVKNKRTRSVNWIEEDKTLLKDLIDEQIDAIEDKNTDTNTNQIKKRAWLDIEESFNDLCAGATRNVKQLKNQWTLMKILAKKELTAHRKELKKTGAGLQVQMVEVKGKEEECRPQLLIKDMPRKKRKIDLTQDVASDNINMETKYREELHQLQIDNEKKKGRNLDLEFKVLQEKLKYYKNKADDSI